MVKLNRTTEYGLMALSYIRNKSEGTNTSAREIAKRFDLPFEILAKTLQKLKEQGVIESTYGTRGGYALARDLKGLSLAEFLYLMEGPSGIVSCVQQPPLSVNDAKHDCSCEYLPSCSIQKMMSNLNRRMYEFFSRISIAELTQEEVHPEKLLNKHTPLAMALTGEEP